MDTVRWSIDIRDIDGPVLHEEGADLLCETASIGKIFLLVEVARRILGGKLDPTSPIEIPQDHLVEESGILYRFVNQNIAVADAALLVGAFSDNLATNALIHMCGLDTVRSVSSELGYEHTSLLDFIRDEERTPDLPWASSAGTARELSHVMEQLHRGAVVSPEVSAQVLSWLASDADTSMFADAFYLDPLAHIHEDGVLLRHKTGTTEVVRADVGIVTGPQATVSYALLANWKGMDDQREPVMQRMRALGAQVRAYVTGVTATTDVG